MRVSRAAASFVTAASVLLTAVIACRLGQADFPHRTLADDAAVAADGEHAPEIAATRRQVGARAGGQRGLGLCPRHQHAGYRWRGGQGRWFGRGFTAEIRERIAGLRGGLVYLELVG